VESRKKTQTAAGLEKKLRRLAASLAQTGLILHGSVNEVRLEPRRPGAKAKPRGPYYLWTWKLKAKTHTVALSEAQVKSFRKAIANHRNLKKIIAQMRELSLQILNATTEGVKKRKPTKNQPDRA
jgi:hypothetical protein